MSAARVARGTAVMAAGQIAGRLASLAAFWALAGALEPKSFGLYQYALQVTGAWAVLAHFHLKVPLVRAIAREPARTRELVGQVLALRLIFGAVVAVVAGVWCWLDFATARERGLVALLLAGNLVTSLAVTFDDCLQAREAFARSAAAGLVVGLIVSLGTLLGALVFDRPLAWAVGSQVVAALVGGALLGWLARTAVGEPLVGWRWSSALAGEMLRLAAGVAVAGLIGAWFGRLDLVAVRQAYGDTAAGQYGLAFRALDVALAGCMSLHAALLPALTRAHAGGRLPAALGRALRAGLLVLVPASLSVTLLAPTLVGLFPADYAPAAAPLAILIWVVPLTLVGAMMHWSLYLEDRPGRVVASMAAGLMTVAAGLAAALGGGLAGAASARLAGELAVAASAVLLAPARLRWLAVLGRPALVAGLMLIGWQLAAGLPPPARWLIALAVGSPALLSRRPPRALVALEPAVVPDAPGDLTIGIVSYNALDKLRACLDSLAGQQTARAVRVVLVDNASSEPVAEAVARDYPWVELVASPDNLGFAAGTNRALDGAATPMVCWLNPDMELTDPHLLERLCARLEAHPEIAAIGCRLRRPDGTEQTPPRRFATAGAAVADLLHLARPAVELEPAGEWIDVPYVHGACLLTRLAVWQRVGGLDPGYFMYFEDADWGRRVAAAGGRLAVAGDLVARHHEGASYGSRAFARRTHYLAALLRFIAVWDGPLPAMGLRLALLATGAVKLLAALLVDRSPDRGARRAFFWDTIRLGVGAWRR